MADSYLYLDTARLGRLSPSAQKAMADFARLAGEEGGSPCMDRFLRAGFDPDDSESRTKLPGLACWKGIANLKKTLRVLAGHRPDLPVLLASRSAQLMKFAARLLFYPCTNVLVTDLGWPEYHSILKTEADRSHRSITYVQLRDAILRDGIEEDEVVSRVREQFVRRECNGLFLTGVSSDGVRLPVERIVREVETVRQVRFSVVDGAQDFCHTPVALKSEFSDLYLAGSSKWLGAFHPLAIGFYGRQRSQSVIETILRHVVRTEEFDDPLFRFVPELEGQTGDQVPETVNLTTLFTCQGAVHDALGASDIPSTIFPARLDNLAAAASAVEATGWKPLIPAPAARTGILLLQAERIAAKNTPASVIRSAFYDRGIVLTAYDGGRVRLSMPDRAFEDRELAQLQRACRSAA
jgi:hypothetical protein